MTYAKKVLAISALYPRQCAHTISEAAAQFLLAQMFNDQELGANCPPPKLVVANLSHDKVRYRLRTHLLICAKNPTSEIHCFELLMEASRALCAKARRLLSEEERHIVMSIVLARYLLAKMFEMNEAQCLTNLLRIFDINLEPNPLE